MGDSSRSVEAIFSGALGVADPGERAAFVSKACAGDEALRARVNALLAAHDDAGRFMAGSVVGSSTAGDVTVNAPPSHAGRSSIVSLAEEPGTIIGHYKLLQKIGEGGFGVVWMADQEKPVRRRVALKIIKAGMDTKEVIARFEQERQALAMMDHPNIAKVLDAGATTTGRPYFVMELVRGVKITDYCDQQGLSTEDRIELFITVCHAIQHAHQKGIIHRDLKPSNILVTVNDGEAVPKVIDFGVAKATQGRITDGTLFTQFEQMIGTPLYMSPEQAEITSLDVDTRSDIYSLGVMLYELLTSRTPIDTATMAKAGMAEVRRLIREVDPPKPSARLKSLAGDELTTVAKRRHIDATKLPGALRGDIDWIVMKCLEKDRKRRYDTANGLAMDLRRHLRNDVVIARPPTTAYLLSKLVRRNKLAFAAGIAVVASLVIGVAVSAWQAVRAERAAGAAKLAEQRAVATLDELRATAPAFAEQARALAAKENFAEAIEKLDYALKLRPDGAEYLVAKADLLQCQFKLAEAAAIYREAGRVRPGLARAEDSAKLCDELLAAEPGEDGKLTRESLAKLHLAMQRQQRPAAELMPVARLLGEEKTLLVAYWLERLKDLPVSAEKPLKNRLSVREDGRLALDLGGTKVIDLSPLAGAPIAALNLSRCAELSDLASLRGLDLAELDISATGVKDLAPLREMHSLEKLAMAHSKVTDLSELSGLRLKSLVFIGCAVSDLTPIRKMPLEDINLGFTRVSDLAPLVGMPIKTIDLSMAPVTDFSPLAKLPLEKCYLQHNRIADLSVLSELPLRELSLWGCANARNYAALSRIKTLEVLLLPSEYRALPAREYEAIGALRDLPNLRQLGAEIISGMSYASTSSKDVFWRDWDREQTFVPALRKTGFSFYFNKLSDGTYRVDIREQAFSDLSCLKGAPISVLFLVGCRVTDLTPLHDLPLRYLHLGGNPVADLSPLRGTSIKELWLSATPVTDLSPLRETKVERLMLHKSQQVSDLSPLAGMPLKRLDLADCINITDVAPVLEIPTLEELTIPRGARNIGLLRKMPNLKLLDYKLANTNYYDGSPPHHKAESNVADFWRDFDANPWIARLIDAGIKPKTLDRLPDGAWEVNLDGTSISDLTLLQGARISSLSLVRTDVADLRPIADLPLASLNISRTKVTDLDFLRDGNLGASLRSLDISMNNITDFTPLAACTNLETFRSFSTAFSDPGVLKSKHLKELWLAHTRVADLSTLAGMPLRNVYLDGCAEVTDISPLSRCPTLELLILPPNATRLETLRGLPNLKHLSYTYKNASTAADFWKEYDANRWIARLRDAGFKPRTLQRLTDDTWHVDLDGSAITDLTILNGAPISILRLGNTAVADLEPLRGMALRRLFLHWTKVTDLSPLNGMPLQELNVAVTKVTDLSPLRGMPLSRLALRGCVGLTDLSPLADCQELQSLALPPDAKDIEFLRALPKLERLSYAEDAKNGYRPDKTAPEFWKEHDSKNQK